MQISEHKIYTILRLILSFVSIDQRRKSRLKNLKNDGITLTFDLFFVIFLKDYIPLSLLVILNAFSLSPSKLYPFTISYLSRFSSLWTIIMRIAFIPASFPRYKLVTRSAFQRDILCKVLARSYKLIE